MTVLVIDSYKPVSGTAGDAVQIANGFQAIEDAVNAIDNNNFAAGKIFDPGKIMQDGATAGQALVWNSGTSKWAPTHPPGYEYTRASFTAPVTSTAVTEGTAATVKASSSVTYDGTEVCIEFFAPWVTHNTNGSGIILLLYEDATLLGEITRTQVALANDKVPIGSLRVFRTPTAAAHTYTVKMWGSAGTQTVAAGAGGTGAAVAGYIKIAKA